MASSTFFDSRVVQVMVIAGMVIVLLVAGFASWKQYERHSRIKQEISVLEAEKERVRKENESLKERISYFATENFQEQESKERLNMRKDNEYVVDIEQAPGEHSSALPAASEQLTPTEDIPNYKKWWEKIF